jgi:hypothetical protein
MQVELNASRVIKSYCDYNAMIRELLQIICYHSAKLASYSLLPSAIFASFSYLKLLNYIRDLLNITLSITRIITPKFIAVDIRNASVIFHGISGHTVACVYIGVCLPRPPM